MADYLTFRITARLPLYVAGPRHRWRVSFSEAGKQGQRGELKAYCVDNPDLELRLVTGPTRWVVGQLENGFLVPLGSSQMRLLCALVARGDAEILPKGDR